MKATYTYKVSAGSRAQLETAIWETAWALFGDDESAERPATLKIASCHVTGRPDSYRAEVTAEGDLSPGP